jgi:hypothetical protein
MAGGQELTGIALMRCDHHVRTVFLTHPGAVNANGLRSSQPLWLALSIGKQRLGEPLRACAISCIHMRPIGAGVISGALSRVTNPISG